MSTDTKSAPKSNTSVKPSSNEVAKHTVEKSITLPSRSVSNVKAIKNSMFADLAIGESVTVGGVIRSLQDKPGQFGDYTEFKGDFGCVHKDLVYRGTKLFLPSVAADTLKNQYLAALEASGASDATKLKIEFKIKLVKTPDSSPKNAQKFQWTFENLLATAPESDKVLALLG